MKIDSTFCKVHQHATGAKKILGNQDIGTSRGGKTTKIHALVNENFQLIGVDLTGGDVHDSKVAIKLLSKVALEGKISMDVIDQITPSNYIVWYNEVRIKKSLSFLSPMGYRQKFGLIA